MEKCLGVRKGTWTVEEDELLRACIHKYGQGKWHLVPQRAGLKRCRKSCRLRWLNYLNPEIKRGDFTEPEADMIFRCHKLLGNRWSLIAGRLPGRTANDVKNYWYSKFRNKEACNKKEKKEETKESNTVKTHVVIKPKPRIFSKNSPWLRRRPMFVDDANVSAREGTSEVLANDPAQPCCGEVSQSEDWTEWWKSLEDKEGDDGKSIMEIWDDHPFMEGQSGWGDCSLNVNLWNFP